MVDLWEDWGGVGRIGGVDEGEGVGLDICTLSL